MNKFSFTGEISLNALDSPNPFIRTGKTKSGDDYLTFGCAVIKEKNNRAYCELFGMVQDPIKSLDSDGNKISISWDDRDDADVIKSVAGYRKNVIKIGEDRHEFITPYDFNNFISENSDEIKGKVFTVTGAIESNVYKGKISNRFKIQSMYEVDPETTKNKLQTTFDYFFQSTDIDTADWNESKQININGYIKAYIDKDNGIKYVMQPIVFDASKIDFENEKHVKMLNYRLKQICLEYKDGKIVNNIKKNKIYNIPVICNYVNGAEEVEFDESQLTDNQKEAIELGISTLDDFRPKGQIYGERVVIYKISNFDITREEYSDGAIILDDKVSEFEEEIYVAPVEESLDEVVEKAESKSDDDDLDEDLFG